MKLDAVFRSEPISDPRKNPHDFWHYVVLCEDGRALIKSGGVLKDDIWLVERSAEHFFLAGTYEIDFPRIEIEAVTRVRPPQGSRRKAQQKQQSVGRVMVFNFEGELKGEQLYLQNLDREDWDRLSGTYHRVFAPGAATPDQPR